MDAEFVAADALRLDRLSRLFDTVLDCGLLHSFDSGERRDYAASLASVTRHGERLYVLCFSDVGPGTVGPHPVSEEQLRSPFDGSDDWSIASVSPDWIQTRLAAHSAPAWLAKINRIEPHPAKRSPETAARSRRSSPRADGSGRSAT